MGGVDFIGPGLPKQTEDQPFYEGKLHRPDLPGRPDSERLSRIEKALDVLLGRAQIVISDDGEVHPAAVTEGDRRKWAGA